MKTVQSSCATAAIKVIISGALNHHSRSSLLAAGCALSAFQMAAPVQTPT